MDKLIKKTNLALVVGTNSWREQFIEAITVSAGECLSLHVINYDDLGWADFSYCDDLSMSKHPRTSVIKIKREINVCVAYMHILETNLDFLDERNVLKHNILLIYIVSFSLEIDKINL